MTCSQHCPQLCAQRCSYLCSKLVHSFADSFVHSIVDPKRTFGRDKKALTLVLHEVKRHDDREQALQAMKGLLGILGPPADKDGAVVVRVGEADPRKKGGGV